MNTGEVEFHVELTRLDQGTEADVLYVITLDTAHPDGYGDRGQFLWVGPDPVASLSFDIGERLELVGIAPDDACVAVIAMDLAGNTTPIAESCGSTPTSTTGAAATSTTAGDATTSDTDAGLDSSTTPHGCSCAASGSTGP